MDSQSLAQVVNLHRSIVSSLHFVRFITLITIEFVLNHKCVNRFVPFSFAFLTSFMLLNCILFFVFFLYGSFINRAFSLFSHHYLIFKFSFFA